MKGIEEPVRRLGIQTGSALKSDSERLMDNKSTSDFMKPPEKAKKYIAYGQYGVISCLVPIKHKGMNSYKYGVQSTIIWFCFERVQMCFIDVTEPKIHKVTRQRISLEFLI